MPYSVKGFFEINEDMVQILLMLEDIIKLNKNVKIQCTGDGTPFVVSLLLIVIPFFRPLS